MLDKLEVEGSSFSINDEKKPLNISPVTEKKSILVATPMYGGNCTGQYTMSLISCINTLSAKKVETFLANLMNESLITRARNELARLFLNETSCTHLMFIDADMGFEHDSIYNLFKHDKDIVCGLYAKKEINWKNVHKHGLEKSTQTNPQEYMNVGAELVINLPHGQKEIKEENGLIELRHGGTGFMMIKREVFKRLSNHVKTYRTSTKKDEAGNFVKPYVHQFFDTSIDETGALLSEDYHFCELWRKHGGKVYADPNIKLKHIGTHTFEGELQV